MKSKFGIIANFGTIFFVTFNRSLGGYGLFKLPVMVGRIRFTIIFLLCVVGINSRLSAQEAWTLEQCIRYAYDNNISLKQEELKVTNAENNLLQSKVNLFPTINASSGYSSAKGRVWDSNTAGFVEGSAVQSLSGSISSAVTIFNVLQQKNTLDRNRFALMSGIQNVEKLKNDLSINITLYYLQIIHAEEQLAVAEDQLATTNLQVDRTKALVDAGSVPEGDLFEIQSQAAREELQVVTARNTLDLAKLNLAQLLDLETMKDFHVTVPDFSNIGVSEAATSVDDIFATAEDILPQVKAAEYDLAWAGKSLALARGGRSPVLSLSAGANTAYSNNWDLQLWDQLSQNYSINFGANLRIPIFNGWQVNTRIKNAKLDVRNYQYQLQLTKNTLYKEIQQAHADAVAALKKYLSSAKAVASMEEAFRYAEQRYEVGMVNFVDYSTNKTRLTAAQSEMLQAKFEYIFKTKVLDFYSGRPITL